MSKSKPQRHYCDDSLETIKKINRAFTGAVSSLGDHLRLGGIPEACSVFALQQAFNSDDFEVKTYMTVCKGELMMSELKK